MARKNIEKKILQFELNFQDILICNTKGLRPNLEVLIGEPENVSQQNLGTLFGIFEITDDSEDSSYIVNYLVSIIKKEFFSRPKRGPIESFEGALHKTNLALAKLAEHENIGWVGNLNAVCALIERNQLHFTQTGNTSVLLFRNKQLINLSEGIEEENLEPNPLKTFADISSGKIEEGDRIIVTTNEIFNIFSLEEIKKSALRFSQEKFLQFLKTALGNELEKIVLLSIGINQKESPESHSAKTTPSAKNANFFSQNAFEKPRIKTKEPTAISLSQELEIAKSEQEQAGDFTDKKTGHIYIKENYSDNDQGDFSKRFSSFKDSLSQKKLPSLEWKSKLKRPDLTKYLNKEKTLRFWKSIWKVTKTLGLSIGHILLNFYFWIIDHAKQISRNYSVSAKKEEGISLSLPFLKIQNIRKKLALLSHKQKLYVLLVLFLLLVAPYFIAKYIKNQESAREKMLEENAPSIALPLENEKNLKRVESLSQVFETPGLKQIINLNGTALGLTQDKIVSLDDNNLYELKPEMEKIKLAVPMNDLNLILILTENNQIISFSPIAKKFQTNTIGLPSSASSMGTFLTYLYVLSPLDSQIYRYPRAEGGFGDKTNWIRESDNLNGFSQMAVNESIYLSNGKELLKFFKGKKQDFSLEAPLNPLGIDAIFTTEDSQYVYLLDKANSRIVKIDSGGQIVSQFYNPEIKEALNIAIFEDKNLVYFTTDSAIKSFSLE